MPAILAATLLMGMIGLIFCGVSTWVLFQKRGELAVRTVRGSYIPDIEQSRLDPSEKEALIRELELFCASVERGEVENWQAAGVMQRLQRLPVLQWGELSVIESFIQSEADASDEEDLKQLSRLRQAAKLDVATSFDFEDVLSPAHIPAENSLGRKLAQPLTGEMVGEVVTRAVLVADRSEIPEESFLSPSIVKIVKKQIEAGIKEGGF